ncbi:MAG: hypothetical protein ACT4QG_07205 [Sporichthyaceae bacterium]
MNLLRTQWDRAIAIACAIGGVVALFVGWFGTSGTEHVAEQLPYIASSSITGIFLLGVGATLWLTADLRDEWRELRRVGNLLETELAQRRAHR